ncbi:MAG TPA: GNAT family N-acetyltransferase [Acidimicrobiales bacterium]|nr:GNAT family N-acetyltransferase [Acidimicrobiales bacterium]
MTSKGESTDETIIVEATDATPELVDALHRLIPQLSNSADPITSDELSEIIASPASVLLVARDRDERVVGTLTLGLYRAPTGLRAWIEDVVVDSDARGLGVGAALVRQALVRAQSLGARTVDLTSRPSREEANRLYQKLGFSLRATNVYRYDHGTK